MIVYMEVPNDIKPIVLEERRAKRPKTPRVSSLSPKNQTFLQSLGYKIKPSKCSKLPRLL